MGDLPLSEGQGRSPERRSLSWRREEEGRKGCSGPGKSL